MIPGLTLVRVLAIDVFTETTRHGQFHGDPDSARNCRPKVPDYVLEKLLGTGKIALLEQDEDEAGASPTEFTMTYKPIGQFLITGPGIDPETVRGKATAEARLAELRAGTGSDEAPTD